MGALNRVYMSAAPAPMDIAAYSFPLEFAPQASAAEWRL